MESIKVILENNNCTFNDEFYRKNSRIAMGTIFTPTYAALAMGYFEVGFYIYVLKWGKEFQVFISENWSRFLGVKYH